MGFLKKFHGDNDAESVRRAPEVTEISESPRDTGSLEARQEKEINQNPNQPTDNVLPGQQKVEAAALVWPKKAVYGTYAWIWVCFFMLALQQGMTTQLNAYAYAEFSTSPQITTAYICATIIGGILKLPIAKLLNIWGRAEGFLFFVGIYLLGMIIIASCSGPSAYAAGYTLYWIGYDAVYFIMDVFVADTSGLRNRAWAFGFVTTPFICTAFTAPLLATAFLEETSWRWGYGAFCIIMTVIFVPLGAVFKFYQLKAKKMGLLVRADSGRTTLQSIIHYTHEFDLVGAMLLMAAFILLLLPFSLAQYGLSQYSSASFIAMVVVGVVLFPVFAAWEKFYARTHFVKWELFKQRTVLGACCLSAVLYFSFYCWDLYYYNYSLVVYNLNTTTAGYMTEIYNVGSSFWGFVFGVWVRQTKHFKHACLFFGLPLMFLGAGLMIHFRGSEHAIGYLVMCQIFIAVAGGTLVIGEDMAVMASADRDGVPMMLALVGLSSSVGGAIGYSVAGAIYDNVFPKGLLQALPADAKSEFESLYLGGYLVQTTYAPGTEIRDAVDFAWAYSQKYMCIAATAILVLAIPAVAVWKNYNVDKHQNKGTVI